MCICIIHMQKISTSTPCTRQLRRSLRSLPSKRLRLDAVWFLFFGLIGHQTLRCFWWLFLLCLRRRQAPRKAYPVGWWWKKMRSANHGKCWWYPFLGGYLPVTSCNSFFPFKKFRELRSGKALKDLRNLWAKLAQSTSQHIAEVVPGVEPKFLRSRNMVSPPALSGPPLPQLVPCILPVAPPEQHKAGDILKDGKTKQVIPPNSVFSNSILEYVQIFTGAPFFSVITPYFL